MSEKHDRGAPLRRRISPRGDRGEHTPKGVRYLVGRVADVKRGESMKFLMPVRGAEEECFVINFRGHLHAYVNRCRHVPMAMDWVDNQFFAEEGRYLMCQTTTRITSRPTANASRVRRRLAARCSIGCRWKSRTELFTRGRRRKNSKTDRRLPTGIAACAPGAARSVSRSDSRGRTWRGRNRREPSD